MSAWHLLWVVPLAGLVTVALAAAAFCAWAFYRWPRP